MNEKIRLYPRPDRIILSERGAQIPADGIAVRTPLSRYYRRRLALGDLRKEFPAPQAGPTEE